MHLHGAISVHDASIGEEKNGIEETADDDWNVVS